MRISIKVFVIAGTMAALAASAAPQTDPKFEQLAALVTQKMAEYHIPGVAFGIVKNGQAMTRGFGVTNVDQPQPINADTVYPIASISKTVVATAMMRLVEQGKIDLEAPVRRYLPDFRLQDETQARDVAIWNLLTHTPGWEGQLSVQDRGNESLANFVQSMSNLQKLAAPGEVWSYNNAGFGVAGRVIEVVTGKVINDALPELVFQPLGLTRSFSRLGDVVTHRFAAGHRDQQGQAALIPSFTLPPGVAAGGLAMSLNDLLAYGKFHLGDGNGSDGKPVLARASLQKMRTPRLRKNSTDDEMGIGWHLRKWGGVTTAAHGGTLGGHCLLLELVPERNLIIGMLTNHSNGWRLIQDVERTALKLYEGVSLEPKQAIGHRGVNETLPDVPILVQQPPAAQYAGTYQRPPSGTVQVREENGRLMVGQTPIAFFGPDQAVATDGNQRGNPYEFIRKPDGTVGWIRVVGRIARKD